MRAAPFVPIGIPISRRNIIPNLNLSKANITSDSCVNFELNLIPLSREMQHTAKETIYLFVVKFHFVRFARFCHHVSIVNDP
jgi:hypothetical protein